VIAILAGALPGSLAAQADSARVANGKGAFFTLGGGYGSIGCNGCDRDGGRSARIEVGGWLSPTVQLGFGVRGLVTTDTDGVFATAGPILTAYFGPTSPVFFTGLLGVAAGASIDSWAGVGASGTIGVELPISRSAALAPYFGIDYGLLDGTGVTMLTGGIVLRVW
jgi:hypothetical protein